MKFEQPKIYIPKKAELLELGFEIRSEGQSWEYYELWIEGQRMFLACYPDEKYWKFGGVNCYPKNTLELKIFIRTLIKPQALICD